MAFSLRFTLLFLRHRKSEPGECKKHIFCYYFETSMFSTAGKKMIVDLKMIDMPLFFKDSDTKFSSRRGKKKM